MRPKNKVGDLVGYESPNDHFGSMLLKKIVCFFELKFGVESGIYFVTALEFREPSFRNGNIIPFPFPYGITEWFHFHFHSRYGMVSVSISIFHYGMISISIFNQNDPKIQ